MMKRMMATGALAALLASGVFAQTSPTTEPVTPPMGGETDPAVTPGLGATPEIVEGETVAPDAELAMPGAEGIDPMEGWTPVDFGTLSSEQLIGTNIVTFDNETVASIEDVLITPEGKVESIVARFGGFLGFGSDAVLLTIDEVEVLQDENEALMVRTNLTPESIESRPVYEETETPG